MELGEVMRTAGSARRLRARSGPRRGGLPGAGQRPVRAQLRISDGAAVAAHLGVGWPAGALPTRVRRRPVAEFATVDRFDGEPFQPGPPPGTAAPAVP